MNTYSFSQNMLRLGSTMGLSQAFFKFLDVAIALNSDHNEPADIQKLLVSYNKSNRYLFMETYFALILEMSGDGSGLVDVLGEFLQKHIGTFVHLTDQRIYDMLPGLFQSNGDSFRVAKYDCHTGRGLLAAAKFNRNLRFFGTDSHMIFVNIALLNLCMNALYGEIAFYNSQTDTFISVWTVDLNYKGKPVIRKIDPETSLLFQKRNGSFPDTSHLLFNF